MGMLWAYLMIPGLSIFYGTIWILLIAYLIKGLPLGVRALSGTIVQVHQELEDCARVFGANLVADFLLYSPSLDKAQILRRRDPLCLHCGPRPCYTYTALWLRD